MPLKEESYKLRKVPRKPLYRVVDSSGKHYSKEGLPKEQARQQQKALYAAARDMEGKGRSADLAEYYSGGGFVDMFNKITGKVKEVVQRAVGVAQKGMRTELPPKARETLRKYGNAYIMGINIRRDPIQPMLNSALNAITLGSWDRMKRVLHYDKLFHLGLELDVRRANRTERLLLEKNEVINLGPLKTRDDDTEMMRVDMKSKQLTLNQFIENARNQMGDRFIPYDPFYNNCQDFILSVLRANGLATEDEATFIKQPIEKLIKGIPEFAPAVAKAVTDLGGYANNILEGEGRLDMATGMFHRAIQPLSGGRISEAAQRMIERRKAYEKLSPSEKAQVAAQHESQVRGIQESAAARQRQVKEYNEEMRRRRESGFAPLVEGLTKAGDIGVKYIAPIVGVPKIVTEAYKAFAPPGSEFYQGTGRLVGGSRFHDILFDTVDKLRQHINSYQIPEDVAQMLHRDLRQLETEAFTLMNKLSTPRAKARMTELDRKTRKYRIVKLFFKYATTELADIGLGEGLDDLMKPMRDDLDSLHDRIHAELAPEAESTDVSEAEDNKTPDRIIRPRAPEDEGSSSSNVASSSNTGSSSNSATGNGRYRRFAGGAKKKDDADDELARIFGRMGMSDSDEDDGMAPPSFGAPATGRETNMEKMLASRKSASPPRSNAAAAPAALAKPVALVKPVAVKAIPKGAAAAPGKRKDKRSAASDSEEEKSASNKKTGKGRAAAVEFVALEPSKAKGKKWTVRLRAGGRPRVVHFGAAGAEDFTISKDNKRKALYIQRHKAREDWTKAGVLTPGFWARHLLWSSPTIEEALAKTRKRFNL